MNTSLPTHPVLFILRLCVLIFCFSAIQPCYAIAAEGEKENFFGYADEEQPTDKPTTPKPAKKNSGPLEPQQRVILSSFKLSPLLQEQLGKQTSQRLEMRFFTSLRNSLIKQGFAIETDETYAAELFTETPPESNKKTSKAKQSQPNKTTPLLEPSTQTAATDSPEETSTPGSPVGLAPVKPTPNASLTRSIATISGEITSSHAPIVASATASVTVQVATTLLQEPIGGNSFFIPLKASYTASTPSAGKTQQEIATAGIEQALTQLHYQVVKQLTGVSIAPAKATKTKKATKAKKTRKAKKKTK